MLASLRSAATSSGPRLKRCERGDTADKEEHGGQRNRQRTSREPGEAECVGGRRRRPGRPQGTGGERWRHGRARSQDPSGAPGVRILRTMGKR